MNRRQALQLLATGAALQLAPAKMFAVLREARTLVEGQSDPSSKTLNDHQNATVKAIAEMILPRTETPGAADVGASDFVDLMLTEWCEEQERAHFISGLADIDARSNRLFGHNFIECAPDQQGAILQELGQEMTNEAQHKQERLLESGLATEGNGNFYSMLRWLTLTAYYTSEAGATQELHYQIIPDRHDECAPTANTGGPEPQ